MRVQQEFYSGLYDYLILGNLFDLYPCQKISLHSFMEADFLTSILFFWAAKCLLYSPHKTSGSKFRVELRRRHYLIVPSQLVDQAHRSLLFTVGLRGGSRASRLAVARRRAPLALRRRIATGRRRDGRGCARWFACCTIKTHHYEVYCMARLASLLRVPIRRTVNG